MFIPRSFRPLYSFENRLVKRIPTYVGYAMAIASIYPLHLGVIIILHRLRWSHLLLYFNISLSFFSTSLSVCLMRSTSGSFVFAFLPFFIVCPKKKLFFTDKEEAGSDIIALPSLYKKGGLITPTCHRFLICR